MKTILLCLALLMLATAAQAATAKCTITNIKNKQVTLDCQSKISTLTVGQKVKMKGLKKKIPKKPEGC